MELQPKSFFSMTRTVILVLALASPAAASSPTGGAHRQPVKHAASLPDSPLAALCTKLTITKDVYWVTLDDSGNISDTVALYPTGTTTITAAYNYTCVPNRTKMSVVWSYLAPDSSSSDQWTFNFTPQADAGSGSDWDSLFHRDGTALDDGQYTAQFYLGQNMATSGTVTLGNVGPLSTTSSVSSTFSLTATTILSAGLALKVEVQGTVVDSKSMKPINGAQMIVLNKGVDPQKWLKNGSKADVYASATTDSRGEFALEKLYPTDVPLPCIISAQDYQPIIDYHYMIPYGTYNPVILTIKLVPAN